MAPKKILVVSLGAAASSLLWSCSQGPALTPSVDTLASAIRVVGYPCSSVRDSTELSSGGTSWRVACEDALIYTTHVSDDGSICVTPIVYDDALVPSAAVQTLDEQCVSVSDT